MELTEAERDELAKIEAAVKTLKELDWRVPKYEVSERLFVKDGDKMRSLKLELRKGPLTLWGF